MNPISGLVVQTSASEDKISLFRSLFRGRDDVYPRRFESRKSGKAGYAPACANEWVRGICEKPRIKCAECSHRRFLAVTDQVIRWHLSGQDGAGQSFVAGVYPLLLDETCFFLALDFDKSSWQDDALAFTNACRGLELSPALERSRSGNVLTSGSSSMRRSPLAWRDVSALTCSQRPWRTGPTSVLTPMTGCSRIRTHCRREGSVI